MLANVNTYLISVAVLIFSLSTACRKVSVNSDMGTAAPDTSLADSSSPVLLAFSAPLTSHSFFVEGISITATDNVAVSGYLISEVAATPAPNATEWSTIPPTTFTFSSEGAKVLHAWTKDAAGNVSTALSAPVEVWLDSFYLTTKSYIQSEYGSSPIKGEIRRDSNTGAWIEKMSGAAELVPASNYSLVVYSRFTPANTTGQYYLVHGDNSSSAHVYRTSDRQKVASLTYDSNPIHTIGEVNEIRWDYTGDFPTRVYFVRGTGFYQMDVLSSNGNPTLIHDFSAEFPGAAKICNDVEGDSSNDSRYWAWQIWDPYANGKYPVRAIIAYDKQSNSIIGQLNPTDVGHVGSLPRPNMVEISPLGTKIITHYGAASTHPCTLSGAWMDLGGNIWEFSGYKALTQGNNAFGLVTANGIPLTKTKESSGAPADITADGQYAANSTSDKFWVRLSGGADPNSQVIVADWGRRPEDIATPLNAPHAWDLDFSDPVQISADETHSGWSFDTEGRELFISQNNKTDWIEARDILTGSSINILYNGDWGWNAGMHFAKFYNSLQRGWFLMSTASTTNSDWGDNQIFMVQTKPSTQNPIVWRVTPSFNNYVSGKAYSYRDEGSAALGFDGLSVWWTANWGTSDGHGETYRVHLPTDWLTHFDP
ncbi:MAG: hypothetical protein A2X94_04785 [Bdellovibrionales bacterium GWB1_55_8]|nr:MAG: hypothetical protein A2X94_04785 [Bdellovibrionales bacterium GWB1_55_8]